MKRRIIRVIDDGSRYTVHQSVRLPEGKYSERKTIAEHLNYAEAMNLINTLRGVSGYCKEGL